MDTPSRLPFERFLITGMHFDIRAKDAAFLNDSTLLPWSFLVEYCVNFMRQVALQPGTSVEPIVLFIIRQ